MSNSRIVGIDAVMARLEENPEIRASANWRSGHRHMWFPFGPSPKAIDPRTFDALVRRGLIRQLDEQDDWRWTKWVKA